MLSTKQVDSLVLAIQDLFLTDQVPWVVGYSGGKDSTAVLQLVWYALRQLPPEQRNRKTVHVISTDTLVEQPSVAIWVRRSLQLMEEAAREQCMPIEPHRLTPRTEDTYWVNLIGRGYPAPRPTFRWCTSRLKIEPSNRFILDILKTFGEAILVLGTRKAESGHRASNMQRYEQRRLRPWLSPNASLPNSSVFSPIEEWSNDDVWVYLMQYANPWGRSNKELLAMYREASPDNDCPLILDTSTPSCGNSRFGCWVCTLVTTDRSMQAMIRNDDEKLWMTPLLEFRNEIACLNEDGRIDDYARRDYRRMDGTIKVSRTDGRAIRGPYTRRWRRHLLQRLLEVESQVQRTCPHELRDMRLITDEELRYINRLWVFEKHEFDNALPMIYEAVKGCKYRYCNDFSTRALGRLEWQLLQEICGGDDTYFELQTSLLDVELQSQDGAVRGSVVAGLEGVIRRCYRESEDDAIGFERRCDELRATTGLSEPKGVGSG